MTRSNYLLRFLLVVIVVRSFLRGNFREFLSHQPALLKQQLNSTPPVQDTSSPASSFIGNLWIPPNRMYSPQEMRTFFSRYSILFIGDSQGRRTYGSLYGILNGTSSAVHVSEIDHPSVIDVNRKKIKEHCSKPGLALCRQNPHNRSNAYDFSSAPCPNDIVEALELALEKNPTTNYSLIVILQGSWDLMRMCHGLSRRYPQNISVAMEKAVQFQRDNLHIVWRTIGTIGYRNNDDGRTTIDMARERNEYARSYIQSHQQVLLESEGIQRSSISVLDWGTAIEPRSWPISERIQGDIGAHYGWQARTVFLQMLMEHLLEREQMQTNL